MRELMFCGSCGEEFDGNEGHDCPMRDAARYEGMAGWLQEGLDAIEK